MDPFEQALQEAYGANEPSQIEVHDLVRVIREAKEDDRIKAIVLNIGRLSVPASSASKLHYLAAELDAFKEAGKEVIAVGDYYSQEQYSWRRALIKSISMITATSCSTAMVATALI